MEKLLGIRVGVSSPYLIATLWKLDRLVGRFDHGSSGRVCQGKLAPWEQSWSLNGSKACYEFSLLLTTTGVGTKNTKTACKEPSYDFFKIVVNVLPFLI